MAERALTRTITAYGSQTAAVRTRVAAFVDTMWDSLPDIRDAAIERFVAAVVPVVVGGQLQIAALTDAYLAQLETLMTGTPVAPIGVPAEAITIDAVRGIPAADVYRRAGITAWTALSRGEDITAASAAGRARAGEIAATDLQLAKTHAAQHILAAKDHVVGYRRVLEGGKSCALCIVASTHRYRRSDLMPIHPHCDCGVAPIFGRGDPGQIIDQARLGALHDAVADRLGPEAARPDARSAADYRDLVVVHEHGELGPVLSFAGQHFSGPTDV